MKKLSVLLATLLFSVFAFGQGYRYKAAGGNKLKFDVGVDAAGTLGDMATFIPFGIGVTAKIGYNVTPKFQLNATTGIIEFLGTTYSGIQYPNEAYVPFRVGFSYLPAPKFHIDASLGSGTFFVSGSSGTGFSYSTGLGYTIADRIDVSTRYEGVSKQGTTSWIGFRVAYRIIK